MLESSTEETVDCPECGYAVGAGPIERCPECGTEVTMFAAIREHRSPSRWRGLLIPLHVCAAWPLVIFASVNILLCVARIGLGRWPGRRGADDPKDIPVVRDLLFLINLEMLAFPITVLIGIILLIAIAITAWLGRIAGSVELNAENIVRRRCDRVVLMAAVSAAVWIGGVVLLLTDPSEALTWYMD
jgi:DNA-directed RNA polymerase subunit RPC12/RpoP